MIYIADYEQIEAEIQNAEVVVCIGAGKIAKTKLEDVLSDYAINKISFFVDNNQEINRFEFPLCKKVVNVFPISKLCDFDKTKMIVILTTSYVSEIEKQLDDIGLGDIVVFDLPILLTELYQNDILAMRKILPNNIKLYENQLIPKVIHYCWFGGKDIPDKNKKWMESWQKFCPDYEIKRWDESNYDISKNRFMLQAYEEKQWAFVPDYARLDIVYNHGGIYLDVDVEIVKNFDDLLYAKGFAGFESDKYVAFGLGFGAQKKLPIIKKLRDQYEKLEFRNTDGSLNLIGSPNIQTKNLLEDGLIQNGEYQIVRDLVIYPEKMLCGKSVRTMRTQLTDYTHSIHQYDASWITDEVKIESQKRYKRFANVWRVDKVENE